MKNVFFFSLKEYRKLVKFFFVGHNYGIKKNPFCVPCYLILNKENENRTNNEETVWVQKRACNEVFYTKPILKNAVGGSVVLNHKS